MFDELNKIKAYSFPKELLKIIFDYIPQQTHAKTWKISSKEIDLPEWSEFGGFTPKMLLRVKNVLFEKRHHPQRGDLIDVEVDFSDYYENDGLLIYDGKDVVNLDYTNDYGNVPKEFKVITEFPIDYWHNDEKILRPIKGNTLVWIDHIGCLDELLKNIRYDQFKETGPFLVSPSNYQKHVMYTYFVFDDQAWYIIYSYTGNKGCIESTATLDPMVLDIIRSSFEERLRDPDQYFVSEDDDTSYQNDPNSPNYNGNILFLKSIDSSLAKFETLNSSSSQQFHIQEL